ncbi:hypothetical protein [Rosistilla oblonga]|uniref:hypothetical protein n=1 Tax=Rosistilla oblonga TaxID=2527990 RepID=UPI003A96FFE7
MSDQINQTLKTLDEIGRLLRESALDISIALRELSSAWNSEIRIRYATERFDQHDQEWQNWYQIFRSRMRKLSIDLEAREGQWIALYNSPNVKHTLDASGDAARSTIKLVITASIACRDSFIQDTRSPRQFSELQEYDSELLEAFYSNDIPAFVFSETQFGTIWLRLHELATAIWGPGCYELSDCTSALYGEAKTKLDYWVSRQMEAIDTQIGSAKRLILADATPRASKPKKLSEPQKNHIFAAAVWLKYIEIKLAKDPAINRSLLRRIEAMPYAKALGWKHDFKKFDYHVSEGLKPNGHWRALAELKAREIELPE